MRGTCKSEGNFTLWRSDAADAFDTMAWISASNWSDGRVFSIGASADGIASFQMPMDGPPQLKGQFIIVATAVCFVLFCFPLYDQRPYLLQ